MMDDEFDELLRDAATSYNAPPEPPREAMWAAIARARDAEVVVPILAARGARRWLATGAAAAAVLLLGIAIGRFSGNAGVADGRVAAAPQATTQLVDTLRLEPLPPFVSSDVPDQTPDGRVASSRERQGTAARAASAAAERGLRLDRANEAGDRATDALSYRFAVVEHLTRAEVLLTGFRAQAGATDGARLDAQFTSLARELLGTTRLLLATRRTDDAAITRLLEDLELVLMQLSQYAKDGRRIDLDAINQSLDKRNVLPKLRSNIPSGVSASAGT